MAETRKKSGQKDTASHPKSALSNEPEANPWAEAALRVAESEERSRAWVERGRPQGEEPWRNTDWTALSHLPEARDELRSGSVLLGVRSLAELRDLLDHIGRRVISMGPESGRGVTTPLAEVVFALRDCIIAEGEPPKWSQSRNPSAPRGYAREGVDGEKLQLLGAAAREVLSNALTAAPSSDTHDFLDAKKALLLDFNNDTRGNPTRNGFGRALVKDLKEARTKGLEGDALAAHLADKRVWLVSPFYEQQALRWKEQRQGNKWAELLCFCREEGLSMDAESDAVSLLKALGVDAKSARNVVNAVAENRTSRRGKKPAGG